MIKKTALICLCIALLTGCSSTNVPDSPETLCSSLDSVTAKMIQKAVTSQDFSEELNQLNKIADSFDENSLTDSQLKFGLAAVVVVTNPSMSGTFSLTQIGEGLSHMRVACKAAGYPWVESEKNN